VQAQVLHGDQHYWIENVSASNPILHNGRPLSTGMRVALRAGDEIKIGGYALQAAFENDETSATILRGRTVIPGLRSVPAAPKFVPAPAKAPAQPVEPPRNPDPGATLAEEARDSARPSASPAGTQAPTGESLWRSFLEGAGIELPLPDAPLPELLRGIGEMMKIAVGGLHSLVTMRSRVKNEMQAEMTMIQVRDNNPLKFSPDAVLALQMLLQPPARGFLAGPAALRDTLADLQAHQVGMTAGMRSVLEAVLDRLDPKKLEARPRKHSMFDRLMPKRRKAIMWDLYLKQHISLRAEAQYDSQRFFGEAFRDAYEAQVRNLEGTQDATVVPGTRGMTPETRGVTPGPRGGRPAR
jgi:FHA domain-containing protein